MHHVTDVVLGPGEDSSTGNVTGGRKLARYVLERHKRQTSVVPTRNEKALSDRGRNDCLKFRILRTIISEQNLVARILRVEKSFADGKTGMGRDSWPQGDHHPV